MKIIVKGTSAYLFDSYVDVTKAENIEWHTQELMVDMFKEHAKNMYWHTQRIMTENKLFTLS